MEYAIRQVKTEDLPYLREICYKTSHGFDTDKKRRQLYLLYCDYYALYAKETSFVAVNGDDIPVGYVFCAPDFCEYAINYKRYLLKPLYEVCFLAGLQKSFLLFIEKLMFARKYKAHLHIDIHPGAQRQGLGHRLIDALSAKLRSQKSNGVYLLVDKRNEKGVNFYKKYGFCEIMRISSAIQYVLKF